KSNCWSMLWRPVWTHSALMDRDRREVVFQGASQSPVAFIRQENGLAIGSKKRPQPGSGRNFRQAGKLALELLTVDFAKIGHRAFAKMGEFGIGKSLSRITVSHDSLLLAGRP